MNFSTLIARLLYVHRHFEIFKTICCFLTHENVDVNPESHRAAINFIHKEERMTKSFILPHAEMLKICFLIKTDTIFTNKKIIALFF